MTQHECDITVIGSGFGGSLLALIARRLGRSVVLLEKGQHPRFAIGESSTPLANLLLESLAKRYDLPNVSSFAKFGSWQSDHPEIACGLKRGFSFFHHSLGQPWSDDDQHQHQLLVAASPHNGIADTHWYRPEFDHFLVSAAQESGVAYHDNFEIHSLNINESSATIQGQRNGQAVTVRSRVLIDASGPRGFLHQNLSLPESPYPHLPDTMAVFAHFRDVRPFADFLPPGISPPYPVDDAALHHLFRSGWIWVLRFNNGVTSAGAALTRGLAESLAPAEAESIWNRVLGQLPTVHAQFASARPIQPWQHLPRLSFRCHQIVGSNWALMPSAAGFVDPLLSTGFTLNLLGLQRLARILEEDWNSTHWEKSLSTYQNLTHLELDASALLISALYAHLDDFPVFAALSRLYFAAVSFTESAWRLDKPELAGPTFLLSSHPEFYPNFQACCLDAISLGSGWPDKAEAREGLLRRIQETIEPFDVAGLLHPKMPNWHPVRAEDLFDSAAKLDSSTQAIKNLLDRSGFYDQ